MDHPLGDKELLAATEKATGQTLRRKRTRPDEAGTIERDS